VDEVAAFTLERLRGNWGTVMKSDAVRQATERLLKARQAAADLAKVHKDMSTFRSAWSDFLIASSAIYSKLEQGAKGTGTSQAWFGRKKHERKTDSLLRYIHHARNADYHGIEDVSRGTWAVDIEYDRGTSFEVAGNTDNPHELNFPSYSGKTPPQVVNVEGPTPLLISVVDSGVRYDPPTEHAGQPITDKSPAGLASLAVNYLQQLIDEARKLP
jgi:hypothetical protein